MTTDLGNRMKNYENKLYLPENLPLIVRIDGRSFHTVTRSMEKPFDADFINMMNQVGIELCKEIQNCRMAYLQSDEISFLLYQNQGAQPWFGNEIQKITSITASLASSVFSLYSHTPVAFDSRIFILPPHEVTNYFVWRQLDWQRNSIQMLARHHYSHRELKNVSTTGMLELLSKVDVDWNSISNHLKLGRTVVKTESNELLGDGVETYLRTRWMVDEGIKRFTEDRSYIETKMLPDFAVPADSLITKIHTTV